MASNQQSQLKTPQKLPFADISLDHNFVEPTKCINDGHDVPAFLISRAYSDIGLFITQLNIALCPQTTPTDGGTRVQSWHLGDAEVPITPSVLAIQQLLINLDAIIEEAPPDLGPRRFGNVSFRRWYELLEARIPDLLDQFLPTHILDLKSNGVTAKDELKAYLLGGFGSAQRLDYGTGHELSFLAFLGCVWKLRGFHEAATVDDGSIERSVVFGIIEP